GELNLPSGERRLPPQLVGVTAAVGDAKRRAPRVEAPGMEVAADQAEPQRAGAVVVSDSPQRASEFGSRTPGRIPPAEQLLARGDRPHSRSRCRSRAGAARLPASATRGAAEEVTDPCWVCRSL